MGLFRYKALDVDNTEKVGKITSSSREEAIRDLQSRQINVYSIQEVAASGSDKMLSGPVKQDEYFRFIEQIGILVKAGVPVLEAVDSLKENVKRQALQDQLNAISKDLRQGTSFSDAVAINMSTLPSYAPHLFRMAEATGKLADVAGMIAGQMRRAQEIRKELKSALNYPLFLFSVGVLAVGFIFYFIVPRFAGMVAGNEDKLPAFTRMVFETGLSFKENFVLVMSALGGLVALLLVLSRQSAIRKTFIMMTYKLPIIGKFMKLLEEGTWLRVLGLSTQAGARLLDGLELAASAAAPAGRRHAYAELQQSVRSGVNVSEAVKLNLDIDPLALNLISTGQKAGQLPEMLLIAAEAYDEEIEVFSKRLTALAEPIAIMFISAIVGGVVISLVTAMTSIYDVAL